MRRMLILFAAGCTLLTSCFVKEDRSVCPCWLNVDLTNVDEESVTVTGWKDGKLFQETMEEYPDIYETTVPRGEIYVSTIGPTDDIFSGTTLAIPEGKQADSLYAHSARLNTSFESITDYVTLHKQFATVHLVMQVPDGIDVYPYDLRIIGNTGGWDIRDLSGANGTFQYSPQRIGANEYEFRVPRQQDSSLKIEMLSAGTKVDEVALGEIIAQSGFDWTAEDLADITLDIRFKESQVLVKISGWDKTIILDVVI